MFKLIIAPQAKQQLKKLPRRYKDSIRLLLKEIKEDPLVGKPLGRELIGKFSVKMVVYRIIYKINKNDRTVFIISAGHRSTVYIKPI